MKKIAFALMAACALCLIQAQAQSLSLPDAPKAQPGFIVGTVVDVNGDPVPGAHVVLEPPSGDTLSATSDSNGSFHFGNLQPGAYQVSITAQGFAPWTSPGLTLHPGQYMIVTGSRLQIEQARTQVDVVSTAASRDEIAAQEVKIQEQQRILGFIPNFYVAYDGNAAPLTAKAKFKLASRVLYDPVTIAGVAFFSGINQAADNPNYGQGAKGYAQRFGAAYADGFTDIMVGGALLPSLLHQDPRYFYQGTGTTKSRLRHALLSPFICKGDNGRWEPNYSTMGGDLASAALANTYYPDSNRGPGLFLGNFFINTGQRALANVAQEFILRKITSKPKDPK